jgi:tetratricopeptide (TPR) repeat protein
MMMWKQKRRQLVGKFKVTRRICVYGIVITAAALLHAQSQSSAKPRPPLPLVLQSLLVDGTHALDAGDNARAAQDFREAARMAPQSIRILNDLAIALARQGKDQEAISVYKQALLLQPGNSITRKNLGIAYFRAHEYTEALPYLEAYAKSDPTLQSLDLVGVDQFALNQYSRAADSLEQALRVQPGDLPTLDLLGKAYWRAKNHQGVISVFDRIMAVNPNSAPAHYMLGLAYDLVSKEDDAYKEFSAVLAADPRYPGAHSSLGLIDWRMQRVSQAKQQFLEELALHPDDPISNYMMGKILRRENQIAQAVPYLQAAIAANPNYLSALLDLGQCEIHLNDPAKAVPLLEHAIRIHPEDAQAHFVLGTAYSMLGETAAASRERAICGKLLAKQHAATSPGNREKSEK